MLSARHFLALFVCLFSYPPAVFAQERQPSETISKEATIIIEQNHVRFTSQKPVQEMQLQVFDHGGELIYDSGATTESEVRWRLQGANGEDLKNGLYSYTLTIKDLGAEAARTRRGHFIVDRLKGRDGADKLWVTSQSDAGVGAELIVARDETAAVAGTTIDAERTLGTGKDHSGRNIGGREVEAEAQGKSDIGKTALAAALAGTVGRIAKFTTGVEVGDSVITEANGNIGIGTTAPVGNLHVHGSTGITTTGSGAAFFFRNRETTTNTNYWAWYAQSNLARLWHSDLGDILTVTPGGNVGIGTTSPTKARLTLEGQDALAIRGYEPGLTLYDTNHGNARGAIQQVNGGLNLFTENYLRGADLFGFMRFDGTGNLGIGVATPGAKLDVVSGSGDIVRLNGYEPFITFYDSNHGYARGVIQQVNGGLNLLTDAYLRGASPYGYMRLDTSGNVGIGVANPTAKLQIEGVGFVEMAINSRNERAILALGNTLGPNRYVWTVESGVRGVPGIFGIYNRTVNQSGLEIDGNLRVYVKALQITGGADLSENFDVTPVAGSSEIEPGMVVAIDPIHPGKLELSRRAYDQRVAGVVSGAGGVETGMMMGQVGTLADGKHPVALTGRVYARVDASYGAIKPGYLLTTSPTAGHAMKVRNSSKAHGAIIGKAMTELKSGKGLVLTLITLQ